MSQETETTKSARSDAFSKARTAQRRLEKLNQEEQEELSRKPDEIRAKYAKQRNKIIDDLSEPSRLALIGMGVIRPMTDDAAPTADGDTSDSE